MDMNTDINNASAPVSIISTRAKSGICDLIFKQVGTKQRAGKWIQ